MLGILYGYKMVESYAVVKQEGMKDLVIKRSFKERFFSLPWKPWITHKTIQVPNFRPAAWISYSMKTIYYHPLLKEQIMQSIKDAV